jgi:peptidyl-prolyl cis-trans isomerase D
MLDTMRRGASTWVSKLLLGLLIVSFALWGIPSVFREAGSTAVATVGSRTITAQEFQQHYAQELDRISRQIGRPVTREQALQAGFPERVLNQMVEDALLDEAANRIGTGVSEAELVRMIREDPAFQNNGQFDRQLFSYRLRENGWTEDKFITVRRDAAERDQVADAVAGGFQAPQVLIEATDRYRNEERVVDYVVVTPAVLGTIEDPSPEVLAKFFEERKAAFRSPELRKAQYLPLTVEAIAKPADVTDDDAKAVYERSGSRFGAPERRRVDLVGFAKKEDAEAAAARLKEGTSFDDLMAQLNVKPEDADQGLKGKTEFLDPRIAEAVFALGKVGDVSGVVEGRVNRVLLRLTETTPAGMKPFDEVKGELKDEIARSRAETEITDLYKQIEDARGARTSLPEIAKHFSLTAVTIEAIDRQGRDANGAPVSLPDRGALLKALFESDVDADNPALQLGQSGYLWFDVLAITPPRDRALDEVRDAVVAQWKAEQTRIRLSAKAAEMLERLQKGESLEDVAKSAELEVKTSPSFKRGQPVDGLGSPAVAAAFGGPDGHVATSIGEGDSRVLLKVTEVTEPVFFAEAETAKAASEQLSNELRRGVADLYIAELRRQIVPTVDRAFLARLVGPTSNTLQN